MAASKKKPNSQTKRSIKAKQPTPKVLSPSSAATKKRVRKLPEHRHFRLTKQRIRQNKPLPGVVSLLRQTIRIFTTNKWLFTKLILLESILVFVFIKGFGTAFDIVSTKNEINEFVGSNDKSFETSYSLFSYLVGSFNSQVSETTGVYQMFITLVFILATIWLTRELLAGRKPPLKYGFYRGMYPLIPFILVLAVISIQLIPAAIGNAIFSIVLQQGLAVTLLEKVLWFLLFASGILVSLYMVLSSIFALNIVTLQDVTPMQALRSARGLVLHRRLGIFARILIAPIIGLLISACIFIPILMFVPVVAEPLFLATSAFGLVFMTVYIYNFYRNLL